MSNSLKKTLLFALVGGLLAFIGLMQDVALVTGLGVVLLAGSFLELVINVGYVYLKKLVDWIYFRSQKGRIP
jgi:hypothetical protein